MRDGLPLTAPSSFLVMGMCDRKKRRVQSEGSMGKERREGKGKKKGRKRKKINQTEHTLVQRLFDPSFPSFFLCSCISSHFSPSCMRAPSFSSFSHRLKPSRKQGLFSCPPSRPLPHPPPSVCKREGRERRSFLKNCTTTFICTA